MNAEARENKALSLEYWVKKLTQKDMPAFAHTARIIAGEASKDESSAGRLAKLILQDPSMTVRLLKMANSPFFNARQHSINTVSRAIVLLGFKTVQNLCLSISILDSIVEGPSKVNVMTGLADCFHAATQARSIAIKRNDKSPEEVFIAALLRQLGQFSFWTFSKKIDKKAAAEVDALLKTKNKQIPGEEKKLLSFTFDELTAALNKEWHISALLGNTLAANSDIDPRVSSINLAHEIARTSKKGWNSNEMKALIKRLAEALYMSTDKVRTMIQDNAQKATNILSKLGASSVGKLISSVENEKKASAAQANQHNKSASKIINLKNNSKKQLENTNSDNQGRFHLADSNLQIQILSDICQLIDESPDLSIMIEMVLEGIYRGVGMDRAIFALLAPDKRQIKTKYALGWDKNEMAQEFHFPINLQSNELFAKTMTTKQSHWINLDEQDPLSRLASPKLLAFNASNPFYISHVSVGNKPIGIIYADRKASNRSLDKTSYSSFKLFCQQANLGLMKISSSK